MNMKIQLKLEELAQFTVCVLLLISLEVHWWFYLLLIIGPDIGMLGYVAGPKVGAFTYNLFHNKAVALLCLLVLFVIGRYTPDWPSSVISFGIILYGHASMDRIFGYGLKFPDSFQHTHLGWIGKPRGVE